MLEVAESVQVLSALGLIELDKNYAICVRGTDY